MAAQPQQEAVNIATLGPQQLNVLREQLSQEVDDLADSHTTLGRLALRSSSAARAVETLGESKKGAMNQFCFGTACISQHVLAIVCGAAAHPTRVSGY